MQLLRKAYAAVIRLPSALDLAVIELQDAEREGLAAMTVQEYAASLAFYNQKRAERLRKFIAANLSS